MVELRRSSRTPSKREGQTSGELEKGPKSSSKKTPKSSDKRSTPNRDTSERKRKKSLNHQPPPSAKKSKSKKAKVEIISDDDREVADEEETRRHGPNLSQQGRRYFALALREALRSTLLTVRNPAAKDSLTATLTPLLEHLIQVLPNISVSRALLSQQTELADLQTRNTHLLASKAQASQRNHDLEQILEEEERLLEHQQDALKKWRESAQQLDAAISDLQERRLHPRLQQPGTDECTLFHPRVVPPTIQDNSIPELKLYNPINDPWFHRWSGSVTRALRAIDQNTQPASSFLGKLSLLTDLLAEHVAENLEPPLREQALCM